MKKFCLFLLITLTLFGCVSSPKIETLFVGEGIIQYFVYPSTLKSEDTKASIDITFRKTKNKDGFVTINFTHYYDVKKIPELKSAGFLLSEKRYSFYDIKILFQEKRNELVRYTSKIDEADFYEILKNGNPTLFIEMETKKFNFPATNDFKEKLKELSVEIF